MTMMNIINSPSPTHTSLTSSTQVLIFSPQATPRPRTSRRPRGRQDSGWWVRCWGYCWLSYTGQGGVDRLRRSHGNYKVDPNAYIPSSPTNTIQAPPPPAPPPTPHPRTSRHPRGRPDSGWRVRCWGYCWLSYTGPGGLDRLRRWHGS